ncbi:MAG: hypothetical protein HQL41_17530, partial [Alphaproteobacteria bacterium]|nr:hypothetical protein [Alphaproteobacteria bacterium]
PSVAVAQIAAEAAPAPTPPLAQPATPPSAPLGQLMFNDASPNVQSFGDLQVQVATASSSTTTTAADTEVQSYVISAKDVGNGSNVQLSVESGMPQWMKVESNGDGTLKIGGERPPGDAETYQVMVKIKRGGGEEIAVMVTVGPSGKAPAEGEAPEGGQGKNQGEGQQGQPGQGQQGQGQQGQGQQGQPPADPQRQGADQAPGAERQAQAEWLDRLLAELSRDETGDRPAEPGAASAQAGLVDQLAWDADRFDDRALMLAAA